MLDRKKLLRMLEMPKPYLPIGLPGQVYNVLNGIRAMELKERYEPGEMLSLPQLSISHSQIKRFVKGNSSVQLIYRSCFEKLFQKASKELDQERNDFDNSMPIYVHGPKGDALFI